MGYGDVSLVSASTSGSLADRLIGMGVLEVNVITLFLLKDPSKPLAPGKVVCDLTATPERMDGRSVLEYFDQRIAAEIRLPEAIDRKLLSPFQYFGVTDTVDLRELRWVREGLVSR